MLLALAAVLSGLALLVAGGERTVAGASALARELGLSTLFVGVTLVATGSSLPEIATTVYAARYGAGDFAVGHIVGSATSQITLGIGVVSLLSPLAAERAEVRTYGGGMLLAMGVMLLAVWSGRISHLEGVAMAVLYVGFVWTRFDATEYADTVDRHAESMESRARAAAWVVFGLAAVVLGGHLLVTGGESVARSMGVPQHVLGALTGLGTTLPEIVIAVLAIHRGESAIAVGTLFGSNITDPLFSLGVGAAVGGIEVANRAAAVRGTAYMLAAAAAVVAVFYWRRRLSRLAGAGCVGLYILAFAAL